MADQTLAKIKAKGCQATGITDEIARSFHSRLGMTRMAVVELQSTSRTENADGDESVALTILSCEVAQSDRASDHLRELQRVLYRNRAEEEGQAVIEESLGGSQSEGDVIRDGLSLVQD